MVRLWKYAVPLYLLCIDYARAAFGVTQDSRHFIVDTGSSNSLVFQVNRNNGDIASLNFRGTEFQNASPYSHIGSGLGSASVSSSVSGDYIKITVSAGTLTHYYIAKRGESTIYMATHITQQPDIGELRYIARLKSSVVPNGPVEANTAGSSSTVEGSDVFVVNGQTRSKFYSSERFIDDKVHCVWGNAGRVCMVMPGTAYETSLGGPFMRDINSNNGGDYNALYWYMNSGHVATEPVRLGLKGPYAMVFTTGGTPSENLDTSFFGSLGITGYVPQNQRGRVSGSVSGIASGFQVVVHWKNSENQYWAYADNGAYTSPYMKPGTYTMILYRDEFKVTEQTVTVSAGSSGTSNISSQEASRNTVWRIGEFNGQPTGFRNADKQLRMHPSDSRMDSWGPLTYTVGGALSGFPMAQIKALNEPTTINFNINDLSGTFILRIGTTLAFAGGRPSVQVNSWSGPVPAAPVNLNSRGFTRGAYRGNGEVYDYRIPAGTLVNGANSIKIWVASGSSGATFLAPNFIYDAVELFKEGGNTVPTSTAQQPITTTIRTSTTTSTAPTTTTTQGGTVPGTGAEWQQCGGNGWTGSGCAAGLKCVFVNEWYSQCQK